MLSLIICSTHSALSDSFEANIQKTIGTEYEIVHIDNSKHQYNIFEAYNEGVARSKGEYLCFVHEDVRFHSKNWGKVVEQHLSQPFVGAIGVAGGNVVLDKLDWRFYGFGHVYLIQGTSSIEEMPGYYISHKPSCICQVPLLQVTVLDGVWICIRKDLFKQIRFDDEHFHDFHLYDSDICMQINQLGLGVFVTHDVLLEHFSEGTFSAGYSDSLEVFARKWKDCLPLIKGIYISEEAISEALVTAQKLFCERLSHDAIVIGLRKKLGTRKDGKEHLDYTHEEKQVMEESAFTYRKWSIKNKELDNAYVWALVLQYLKAPYATRKCKIIMKFIWYRLLGLGKMRRFSDYDV
jgi:glycosyltransferase involved in cell wall biosynthesis